MRYFMGFSNDIGHACTGVGVSEDGIAWRHSTRPVLSPIAGEIDETHAHKTAHAWLNGDLYLIYCAVRPLKGDAERAKFYKGKAWNEYRCLTIARSRPWTDAERASMR